MSGYYENATICINGHVISSSKAEYTQFCDICGKSTISYCSGCSTPIRGDYEVPGIAVVGFNYPRPSYCYKCGNAFPWTEQLLNNAVELISLDEKLSETDKEIIKYAFPDLIVETPSSPVAIAKYKKLIPRAASYVQDGLKNLLVDVVSESIKKSIWG
jgi:hypothetical protein